MASESCGQCCNGAAQRTLGCNEHDAAHIATMFEVLEATDTDILASSLLESFRKMLILHRESFTDELRGQLVEHSAKSKRGLFRPVLPDELLNNRISIDRISTSATISLDRVFQQGVSPDTISQSGEEGSGEQKERETLRDSVSDYHQLQPAVVGAAACTRCYEGPSRSNGSANRALSPENHSDMRLVSMAPSMEAYLKKYVSTGSVGIFGLPPCSHRTDSSPCGRGQANAKLKLEMSSEKLFAENASAERALDAQRLAMPVVATDPDVDTKLLQILPPPGSLEEPYTPSSNVTSPDLSDVRPLETEFSAPSSLLERVASDPTFTPKRKTSINGSSARCGSSSAGSSRSAMNLEFETSRRYIDEHLHRRYLAFSAQSSRRSSGSTIRSIEEESDPHRTILSLKNLSRQLAANDLFKFETDTLGSYDQDIPLILIFSNEKRSNKFVAMLLQCFGALPWSYASSNKSCLKYSVYYRWCLCSMSTISIIGFAVRLCMTYVNRPLGAAGSHCIGPLCDLCLAVGSLLGFLAIGAHLNTHPLVDCMLHLRRYAHVERQEIWTTGLIWDVLLTCLCLISAILTRVVDSNTSSEFGGAAGILVSIAVVFHSSVILALALSVLVLCRGFHTLITSYCFEVERTQDLREAVRAWNLLHAMMRTTTITLEKCFLLLQTIAFAIVLGNVISVASMPFGTSKSIPELNSTIFVALPVLKTFYWTGSVTDLCSRVPSMVNCIFFGRAVDSRRQCVVDYIIHCAAGFYVFEVPITRSMVIKLAYFLAVLAVTMLRFFSP